MAKGQVAFIVRMHSPIGAWRQMTITYHCTWADGNHLTEHEARWKSYIRAQRQTAITYQRAEVDGNHLSAGTHLGMGGSLIAWKFVCKIEPIPIQQHNAAFQLNIDWWLYPSRRLEIFYSLSKKFPMEVPSFTTEDLWISPMLGYAFHFLFFFFILFSSLFSRFFLGTPRPLFGTTGPLFGSTGPQGPRTPD